MFKFRHRRNRWYLDDIKVIDTLEIIDVNTSKDCAGLLDDSIM